MAGVLITAIFISSIVLVLVITGIFSEVEGETKDEIKAPSLNVLGNPEVRSEKESSSTQGSASSGDTTEGGKRSGGSSDQPTSNAEGSLDSNKGKPWGDPSRDLVYSTNRGPPGLMFTEKIGLSGFSMDSQLIGIVIIVILILLVLLKNIEVKSKKSPRRRKKNSK